MDIRSGRAKADDPATCEVCGEPADLYVENVEAQQLHFGCAQHHGAIVLAEIRRGEGSRIRLTTGSRA